MPGGEQHVDAAARAEIEDDLAVGEIGDGGRVAPQRREDGGIGQFGLGAVVQPLAEDRSLDIGEEAVARAAGGGALIEYALRGCGVLRARTVS